MKKLLFLSIISVILIASSCTAPEQVPNQNINQELEQSLPKVEDLNINQDNMQQQALEEPVEAPKQTHAVLKTNKGDIKIKFYGQDSPRTVRNFVKLAEDDFYNGVKFHRVIPDFMIQTGDPNSKDDNWADDGTGGPGYMFDDEFNDHKLVRGSVAMANSGPNTNGSQFFIVTKDSTPWLDGVHTNFGEVAEGMDVVEKIEAVPTNASDHPTEDVVILEVELIE